MHFWLYYSNDVPDWSDEVFNFVEVDSAFLLKKNFKDQEWIRNTSEEQIFDTFPGKGKVVYLVEKDRIKEGKAIMIRVYFDFPVEE